MPQKIREYGKDKGNKIAIRISNENLDWLYALANEYDTKISYVVDTILTCVHDRFKPFPLSVIRYNKTGAPSLEDVSNILILEKDVRDNFNVRHTWNSLEKK